MKEKIFKLIKDIQYYSPLRRYFFHRYSYNFTAPQLCFLCKCLEDTKDISGSIAEVGCAHGATTVFLNKYMDAQNISKDYFAVDTFSGFVVEDVVYEVTKRGKMENYYTCFQVNSKKWYDFTMRQNHISRVNSIQVDVNRYDLTAFGHISFCLLDVDLYRPIKKCLKELYQVLQVGGILVVDDCDKEDVKWDGADQAYKEFMKELGQPIEIVHKKLGIIRKS